MVTPLNEKVCAFYGLSSDEKPMKNVGNGASFLELDTKKVFIFDEENAIWLDCGITTFVKNI